VLTKNVNNSKIYVVSEVGKRLRAAREATDLSVRKFAERFDEDPHALFNIETGKRYPPKRGIKKFAKLLSLTTKQLEALIAVERRGLDPNQMLPEIPPAPIKQADVEAQAEKVLNEFKNRQPKSFVFDGPIPIEEIVKSTDDLNLEEFEFEKDSSIESPHALYGCFYPENFRGKARVVLVNSGKVNGQKLSQAERRVTIAHELAHYFLHYGAKKTKQLLFQFTKRPTYCREAEIYPSKFNSKEHEANVFGACLLMPSQEFKCEWTKTSGDKRRLARCFDVTEEFVCLRAKTLRLKCE
jgi:transcriptional regulator with XRE-family HTH domain